MRNLDALYDFAMEDDPDAALPLYQARHPELADDLAELAADLEEPWHDEPLDAYDFMLIDRAWEQFRRLIRATPKVN